MFCWDPIGKERPYLYHGRTPKGTIVQSTDAAGTPMQLVLDSTTGALLVQVEHYIDGDPRVPTAYPRFLARLGRLEADIKALAIQTAVCDSVTFMELAARKEHEYVLNPTAKDPRQWFGGSTNALEEVLMMRFGALTINVVVIAHVDKDKDEVHGSIVSNPAAPGRLRRGAAAGFSEFYRAYVVRGTGSENAYLWQTRSDEYYNASSQVGAPNPCIQAFEMIWSTP